MVPVWAGEMPVKAADYYVALAKRPESAALFERFRDAWLEERSLNELEKELFERAEAKEAGAWATLGRAYLAAAKTEQALEAFDKARHQSPAAWLDLETARLRLTAKDFAAAEKDALTVPEGAPLRLEALKFAGLACLRAERIDDALAHWIKAVAAAPSDRGLLEDLTELTRREGRFDLALDYCGKWCDATTDAYGKAMATMRRAELLLGSQRFDEAMADLAAVLAVSADDSWLERETIARAEQAHRQRGDATGWATWIGAQAERFPARLNFRKALAQALAVAGKTDESLEVLTEVMRRSPGDVSVRWQRIALLEQAMKLGQAYDECAELAAKEKSETSRLRLAELAFRLEKKDQVKQALDSVLAAADPAKRVGLAALYARYGLAKESEQIWRKEAGGEQGGQALRQLAKHLKNAGQEQDAMDVWKQLGAREVAQDRIEAAQMLSASGEPGVAREILIHGREKFSAEPGYEAALADLAMADDKVGEARAIYLELARFAKQADGLTSAIKGWLRASATVENPLEGLGDETTDRCLRAAWLAAAGKPLPAIREGDALERPVRMALLREQGRWAEIVTMMEALPGERGPLLLNELAEAKTAAGDLTGALMAAQAWRGRVPDQAGPWLFEAGILEKLGKHPEATVLLRRAAARFEDNDEVARRLFGILQESPDPREALEWAWKRHDRSADEAARSAWLREILLVSKEKDQLDELKERFEERVRRDPASPGPLVALAELAKARGDSREELDLLRRAAVNAPRDMMVIAALAALEERSGESARALERYSILARLAPGPDSARQLAQSKIRLGDIAGGMRDLQALAGEKGIDLRALEQSAGDLASRGYVEEATRLLSAVDPAQRTARLNFVLGMLLDCDGCEQDAVTAFIKVLNEPDDPAEIRQRDAQGYGRSSRKQQYSQLLQNYSGQEQAIPGVFTGLNVPQSLFDAKLLIKSQLSRLAMQRGGEIWKKVLTVVPELALAMPEQWREAMDFFQSGEYGNERKGWDFINAHPENPLGIELLVESGQYYNSTPEQVEALLKTQLPVRLEMPLRFGRGEWRAGNLEFLESITAADWSDETVRRLGPTLIHQMFAMACAESAKTPVNAADCARGLAVLEKAALGEEDKQRLELLRARLALLQDSPEDFLRHIDTWALTTPKQSRESYQNLGIGPMDAVAHWRKKAGDRAAEVLIARIKSPTLRCSLSLDLKPEARIARVSRELAGLSKDEPVETRRALTRMKWSLLRQGRELPAVLRKELEAVVAHDSDPRLMFEAKWQLLSSTMHEQELAEVDRLKLQELLAKVATSTDASDQAYAAQYSGYFGKSARGSRMQNTPIVTQWGTSNNFSSGRSSQNRLALPAILAMGEREQAVREAARLLEDSARAAAGRPENLRNEIKALSDGGLLEDALARIALPLHAGLGRQVAMITLLDACSKPERARGLLEEIAKSRLWETRWTVDLALRSPDAAEMYRLLDRVAERGDFDRIMGELLAPQNRENSRESIARLTRLLDWAPRSKGRRAWMGTAMMMLADGGRGGLQKLKPSDDAQLACFRRYVELALDDCKLGELGFRMVSATRHVQTSEAITEAARRALLSGAYTSDERIVSHASRPDNMALSALEHLVLVAEKDGDETAFPAEFREHLKAVDPMIETWTSQMLAAKSVNDLPDVSNATAKSAGWVVLARHEAAMLRAVKMPGRDAWLTGVFRGNQYQSLSENLQHVIRASLLEAETTGSLKPRLFALLEASAGPRKDWGKKIPPNDPMGGKQPSSVYLPQAAAIILKSVATADAAILLEVLDHFREARIPVNDTNSIYTRLAQGWQPKSPTPGKATLSELLRKKPEAAYTLGTWQSNGGSDGKLNFIWVLPQVLQNVQGSGREEMVKAIKDNPDASFVDLLQAGYGTGDRTLQRRALLKAAPALAKLSLEIRSAVIAALIANMQPREVKSLPAATLALLRPNLDALSKQRVTYARQAFRSMKSQPSANQSYQIGSLLGPVMADDEAFVTEVLALWRPIVEADPSGKEIGAFISGFISNARQDFSTITRLLRLVDSVSKGSPPTLQRSSNWGDPMENIWNRIERDAFRDPDFWQQVAALSGKLQAQFWARAPEYSGEEFTFDPKLVQALRQAAKGGEITRAALEWCLQSATMRSNRESNVDGTALLAFAKALKSAGASTADLALLLSRNFSYLPRMTKPGEVMVETPVLLAGLKSFPDGHSGRVFQGVQMLWEKVQRDGRKAGAAYSENTLPTPAYPVETTALLKFALTRNFDPTRSNHYGSGMTRIVLATGDVDLLDLWIKFSGKSLVGDLALIVALLERDRIAEAVALTPEPGRGFSSSQAFDQSLESMVAKLRHAPAAQSFGLLARLSLMRDAHGTTAPTENYVLRRARVIDEFERIRSGLTVADRAALCMALGMANTFDQKHVPALEEFANESVSLEFKKMLLSHESTSAVAKLFIPAVCSRAFANDLSGITLLAKVIAAVPPGSWRESSNFQSTILPIHRCLAAYVARLDGKLPVASVEAILAYARALASQKNPKYLEMVSQYVYLVTTDLTSLEAGLKSCGLEGVKPSSASRDGSYCITLETLKDLFRVALLHPSSSEALLDSLGSPLNNGATTGVLLPSLQESALRAKISPALFLKWNRDLRSISAQDLEAMNLYATERRADFDEAQRTELDSLLQRLQDRIKQAADPARREEMRRRQQEQHRLYRERNERNEIEDPRRSLPPRE